MRYTLRKLRYTVFKAVWASGGRLSVRWLHRSAQRKKFIELWRWLPREPD